VENLGENYDSDVCKLSPWTTGTWQPGGEHYQYHISKASPQKIIHKNAQEQCQKCGAQLPSVINRAENDFVAGLLLSATSG
jgi:hypothetical protein